MHSSMMTCQVHLIEKKPNKYLEQFKWSPKYFFYSTWKISIYYLVGVFVALTKHHMEVMYGCMHMMVKGISYPMVHIGIVLTI